jgi:hypothetical protein
LVRYLVGSGIAAVSLITAFASAQTIPASTALPRFTVASIKPSADNEPGMRIEPSRRRSASSSTRPMNQAARSGG